MRFNMEEVWMRIHYAILVLLTGHIHKFFALGELALLVFWNWSVVRTWLSLRPLASILLLYPISSIFSQQINVLFIHSILFFIYNMLFGYEWVTVMNL